MQFRCLLLIFLTANKHICEKQNSALKSGINNKQTRYRILIEMSMSKWKYSTQDNFSSRLLWVCFLPFCKTGSVYYTHCLLFLMQNIGITFFLRFSPACLLKALNVESETISERQSKSQTNWRFWDRRIVPKRDDNTR